MNEPEEILDVVDDKNNVIGRQPKAEVYAKGLNHRIVHVLVFNNAGEMLLQLRSRNKSFMPGYWVTSAGGHVASGETYETAALRELQEELGVTGQLELLYSDIFNYENKSKKFLATFKLVSNGPFSILEKEVEKVEFFSIEKIAEMKKSGEKFHPEFKFLLEKHFVV